MENLEQLTQGLSKKFMYIVKIYRYVVVQFCDFDRNKLSEKAPSVL